MHNKTFVSALGWFLSIGGWCLWNLILSVLYKNGGPYAVRDGFIQHFGRNLLWWLVLSLVLSAVILLELGVSSLRKTFFPTDTDVFQELQKDKIIMRRFQETAMGHEAEMGKEKKTSMEIRREGEIQELLDRPRVMEEGTLHRRRVSTDLSPKQTPKTRHSIDVAEVFS